MALELVLIASTSVFFVLTKMAEKNIIVNLLMEL